MAFTWHFQPAHALSERGKCKGEGVALPVGAAVCALQRWTRKAPVGRHSSADMQELVKWRQAGRVPQP